MRNRINRFIRFFGRVYELESMGENELKSAIKIKEIRLTATYGIMLLVLYGIYQGGQDFVRVIMLSFLFIMLLIMSIFNERLILAFSRQIDEIKKKKEE